MWSIFDTLSCSQIGVTVTEGHQHHQCASTIAVQLKSEAQVECVMVGLGEGRATVDPCHSIGSRSWRLEETSGEGGTRHILYHSSPGPPPRGTLTGQRPTC
jgi:hypothetical protein